MIPKAYITEWSNQVPWQTNEQVEQDLVICRALVAIFQDAFLASKLAFRGGTALHKLYLMPQPRYSEDIDLVQITAEPFGPIADRIRECLAFLGSPITKQKHNNFTQIYRFDSEFPPVQKLRLKIETNCREHLTVLGLIQTQFNVQSSWFSGSCVITTYQLEELLATKLRALYQRRKGRDLYDMYKALTLKPDLDTALIMNCFQEYMKHSVDQPPSQSVYLQNLTAKMQDDEFLGDTMALLRPTEHYDPEDAYHLILTKLVSQIP